MATETIAGSKVLVTGGLGFVGQNLVRHLLRDHDCDVTIIDNCENSNEQLARNFDGKVTFHKISVLDDACIEMAPEFDYIFHLACIQIAHSAKDPVLDMRVNAESTLRLLERLRAGRGALKRFVYTSSASVYGNSLNFPCSETGATKVLSHYAATKLLGEQYTLIYANLYGLPTTAVRYSNVYGYGQTPNNPYCGVIGRFVHNCILGEPISVYGDGEATRDYTFVDDAIRATIAAGSSSRAEGQVYNIGSGKEASVNMLAETIRSLTNDVDVQHITERSIDNIRRRCMNIDKMYQELGWVPQVSLRQGLAETIEWYRNFIRQ